MIQTSSSTTGGFITEATRRLFNAVGRVTPMTVAGFFDPYLRPRRLLRPDQLNATFTQTRAMHIDLYVAGWVIFEIAAAGGSLTHELPRLVAWALSGLVAWRIIEIAQVTISVSIFDGLSGRPDQKIASPERMVVNAGINFLELLIGFGIFYEFSLAHVNCIGDGFYLSAATQFTVGYGDVVPKGWIRWIAVFQMLLSTAFLVLIFARIVASMHPMQGVLNRSGAVTPEGSTDTPNDSQLDEDRS